MNVLIVGAGGREHALAWKITQSPLCSRLFVAPGNAGTALIAQNVRIGPNDFEDLGNFCLKNDVELVIVGPEAPLVLGIKDYFSGNTRLSGIKVFGPGKEAARLEGSKDFSKKFMIKHGIPTAEAATFDKDSLPQGLDYLEHHAVPVVLKADGLAAGKGVIICDTVSEAKETLTGILLNGQFGDAGSKVLVEEFLSGTELSVFVVTDGNSYQILPEAKDYKRIGEGDTGLNTGGMGAVSPVAFATTPFLEMVEETVIRPTLEGVKAEGMEYVGFIFFGLINVQGSPKVIEYNIRLGDPEAEVILPRIVSDLVVLIQSCFDQSLSNRQIEFDTRAASTVMLVSGGYPGEYDKGKVIHYLDSIEETLVFHAGTLENNSHEVVTNGGRVISLTGLGADLEQALGNSYKAAQTIKWEGMNYRRDIGQDLLAE